MAITIDGLSTLGVELGYADFTVNTTLPVSVTKLGRINSIGGIEVTPETIDASALDDYITKRVAGRSDISETLAVTVNLTKETYAEWAELAGEKLWFEVYHPDLTLGYFLVGTVPTTVPLPDIGQNELLTVEISLTINSIYNNGTKDIGWATAIVPTAPASV